MITSVWGRAWAEQVLADFYKAGKIFEEARSPHTFAGEGAGRSSSAKSNYCRMRAGLRNALYAPFERLAREIFFLSEMQARRFRFMALFGNDAAKPFLVFFRTYNEIGFATHTLINGRHLSDQQKRTVRRDNRMGLGRKRPG